jgi:ectoine hydroxylase-related dioxygenase (phytanoyl-CoA dioxygenase family)
MGEKRTGAGSMNDQQSAKAFRSILRDAELFEDAPETELAGIQLPNSELISQMCRDRDRWRNDLDNFFNNNGYEIIGPFFDPGECDRLVALADRHYRDQSYIINDTAYLIRREEMSSSFKVYDKKTWQIFNVQDIDDSVAELCRSGRIEELFRKRTGWPVNLQSCTIQVSSPEAMARQPWHVDEYSPPSFKAFVYLTDVSDPKYGPYSVVPGSHLNVMRKWRARCLDEIVDLQYAQMELEYKTGEATPLVGEKGDCLISAMTLVHAGWPLHSERTRYVVVFYLNVEPGWTGPFVHGRDHITSQSE